MEADSRTARLLAVAERCATIVWDFDGVVADTEPVQRAAFAEVLATVGVEPSEDFFDEFVGRPEERIWLELIERYSLRATSIRDLMESRSAIYMRGARKLEPAWYVKPLLKFANRRMKPNIVVSSGRARHVSTLLEHWRILNEYDAVFCNGWPEYPRFPTKIARLEYVASSFERPFMVLEDNAMYLRHADAMGMQTVAVQHSMNRRDVHSDRWTLCLSIGGGMDSG